jgi:hypothetical protein
MLDERAVRGQTPNELGFTDAGWEIYLRAPTQYLPRITREHTPPPICIIENGAANPDLLRACGPARDIPIELRRCVGSQPCAALAVAPERA